MFHSYNSLVASSDFHPVRWLVTFLGLPMDINSPLYKKKNCMPEYVREHLKMICVMTGIKLTESIHVGSLVCSSKGYCCTVGTYLDK